MMMKSLFLLTGFILVLSLAYENVPCHGRTFMDCYHYCRENCRIDGAECQSHCQDGCGCTEAFIVVNNGQCRKLSHCKIEMDEKTGVLIDSLRLDDKQINNEVEGLKVDKGDEGDEEDSFIYERYEGDKGYEGDNGDEGDSFIYERYEGDKGYEGDNGDEGDSKPHKNFTFDFWDRI